MKAGDRVADLNYPDYKGEVVIQSAIRGLVFVVWEDGEESMESVKDLILED